MSRRAFGRRDVDRGESERRGLCGLCNVGCWIVATLDGAGRITAVRPDEGTPMGVLCRIGERAPAILYSENRLLHPLRRVGPKGRLSFERISWDEALDAVVKGLHRARDRHGPEGTAIYTGVGSFEQAHCDIYQPRGVAVSSANSVLFPFGSPNAMGVGALCYVAYGMIAPHVTLGRMFMNLVSDIENSDLVVVWGTNPATDLPPLDLGRILDARRRGAGLVVIDPRRTATAKIEGALWVPLRPGTDGALALGLAHVLLAEELHDEAFARDWTVGFDAFARYVRHFPPRAVEEITGVPAGTVVSLARRIAGARGVSQLMYTGLEYSNSGVQAIRAALVLWALAGQLDVPGGLVCTMDGDAFPINRSGHVANPGSGPRIGADRYPLYVRYRDEAHAVGLPDAVLHGRPHPVSALIVLGGSILTSWPDTALWRKTLGALDFLVTIDRQLTADAAYADIVLPATTHFETTSYMTYGSLFRIRERMIEPLGESRPDLRILWDLADRLGYGHLYPRDGEESVRHVLKGSGFTLEDVRAAGGAVSVETGIRQVRKWEKGLLRPDGKPGFDTPSGKFEIASSILEEHGYDPLPVYTEPREGPRARPDLARAYPLVFTSGSRTRASFHTQHVGEPFFARVRPEPAVTLNALDAAERGIADGDRVRIRTLRGSVIMRARVTEDIVRGSVDANHAGGGPLGPEAWRRANVNQLTDMENTDPISGFPVFKALLCDVERAADGSKPLALDAGEGSAAELVVPAAPREPRRVYLDHNATTPPSARVREAMERALDAFGNPSSIHGPGREARNLLDAARRSVARTLGCTPRRVVFTASGSEANNAAIKGAAFAAGNGRTHVVVSAIEHPSVGAAFRWLEGRGFTVTTVPADDTGLVDAGAFARALSPRTLLASVMGANNETGVIQPVADLARAARNVGALFHVDAVQMLGKSPLDVDALGADLLSVSAHKLHGPRGAGALFVRKGVALEALIHGGDQEHGLRASTENLPAVAGFGAACDAVEESLRRMVGVRRLRDRLEEGLCALTPGARVHGRTRPRLPNTSCVTLPGLRGESVVLEMDRRGVQLSAGSACKSGSPAPSPALLAMGLDEEAAHCTVRLSLGVDTTDDDVDTALASFAEVFRNAKRTIRFISCK